MKKMLALVLVLLLTVISAGSMAEGYVQSAQGNNGPVKVEVTVEDGVVTAVTVLEHSETPGLCDAAMEKIPAAIVENQSLKIDTVSGATNTSRAILEAAAAAIEAAGLDVQAWKERDTAAAAPVEKKEDITVTTVVVGAGGAGMKAAIELTSAGHDVLLIEKMPYVGGATNLAATYLVVVDTDLQREAGKQMTVEEYVAQKKATNDDVNEALMTNMMSNSQQVLDWLNALGANITKPLSVYQIGTADGSSLGVSIVAAMKSEMERVGVDCRLNTKAVSLIEENGEIKGVVAEDEGGCYNIYAQNVVLATGGYAASQEAIAKYAPDWVGMPSTTAVSSTGDGHAMAEAVGAKMANIDSVRLNPSVYSDGTANESMSAARAAGAIMVNENGERFCDDYETNYTTLSKWMLEQEGDYVYLIFDQVSMDSSARLRGFYDKGYIVKADTVAELADMIGVPVENLEKTVATYSASVKAGEDKEFGRTLNMNTELCTAPYYATRTQPGIQVTLGGVAVNDQMQVEKLDGTCFDNLYAIGEVAGEGLFGEGPTTIAIYCGELVAKEILSK